LHLEGADVGRRADDAEERPPRWSVVKFAGLDPALISGLPARTAMVWVGPPLFPSGPSIGSVPAARLLLPVMVAPAWLPMRLLFEVTTPRMSAPVPLADMLLATTVLVMLRAPTGPNCTMPPPPSVPVVLVAEFPTIVQFWKVRFGTTVVRIEAANSAPPPMGAVFPLIVQLRAIAFIGWYRPFTYRPPPPTDSDVFPETVQFSMSRVTPSWQ
jgi:hypothetical protein